MLCVCVCVGGWVSGGGVGLIFQDACADINIQNKEKGEEVGVIMSLLMILT